MIIALALGSSIGLAFGPDPTTTIVGETPHDSPYGNGVAVADVDGDGFDDVLLGTIGGVELHPGGPSGVDPFATWTRPIPFLLSDVSLVSRIGDVNGDGFDDVAITSGGQWQDESFVEIWHGSAAGLGASPDLLLPGPANEGGFGIDVAGTDVDLDGTDDLLVVTPDTNGGRVEVFLGSATGLTATSRVVARGSRRDPVTGPVAAGDHDGDGHVDLVVGAGGDATAYLLLGDGTGSFTHSEVSRGGDQGPHQVGLVDFDGDGLDEVVLAGSAYQAIWVHGGGSGASGVPLEFPVPGQYLGALQFTDPYDVNGDGLEDLVFAGLISVVTALGSPTGPVLESYDAWAEGEPPELGPLPFLHVDVGDVDGDGETDYVSDSYWSFTARVTYGGTDLGGAGFLYGAYGSMLGGPSAVGDVDGDGIDDVLARGEAYLGSAAGLTDVAVPYTAPPAAEGVQLDVDGNGVLDTVIWNGGVGWFRDRGPTNPPDQIIPAPAQYDNTTLVGGDVDGDGYDDLYVHATHASNGTLFWFRGSPAGLVGPVVVPGGEFWDDLGACVDATGDGRCDLLGQRDLARFVSLHGSASGPGAAGPVPALRSPVSWRDLDGDGTIDLLGRTEAGKVVVMYGGPTGWDGTNRQVLAGPGWWSPVLLGDVDGDGFEDVAVTQSTAHTGAGEVRIHYGTASGLDPVPTTLVGVGGEGLGSGVAAIDVDDDGVKELVVGASNHADGAGALHVYEP